LGGVFCYFIALRFALAFLIGLGFEQNVRPMISLQSYYDMFFNLHIGLGLVFQMPIVIFFFTLLRITTPGFLLSNGRYAILIIFVLAAVITPTPDVTTMLTFAAPMVLLFYVGIGASYLIVMKREGRNFPWFKLILVLLALAALLAGFVALLHYQFGYTFSQEYPWFLPPS
jgi:sec-independent protein translocase protein TatC